MSDFTILSVHPIRLFIAGLAILLAACSGGDDGPDNSSTPRPPGQSNEPIPEDAVFNTALDFMVTREPGPRIPVEPPIADLTDADFARGLPESIVQLPEGVDPTLNQAPFFANLENVDVEAGDFVEIIYLPQDNDGELPGMFPEELPQGGSFIDNFDGSKTFRWQPLQMDVGIKKFTVTAVDSADSRFRVSQPLLIRITLPEDPSTIPNVAPMLDTIIPHTVRVGDPVVFELKGIDLNGSVPTIEIPQLPSGASFTQHPRFEEVFVLKLLPAQAGTLSIDVIVRDSIDTGLSNTESISMNVVARDAFNRSGESLRELAETRNIQIGFAALQSFYHRPDGAIYASTAAREFNIVTPENSMKMDYINPERGRYQFAATDNLIRFAQQNSMAVHGHPLVWYRQLPAWIENSAVSERESHMLDHITQIMSRYSDDISLWDVVNEPIAANGQLRDSIWLEAMGESYIDKALTQAREVSSDATLLINEFDIAMSGAKVDGLLALIDRLQASNVPLDGIGFQLHLFSSFDQFDELRANFAEIAGRNLDIFITELDVSLNEGATEDMQADVYRQIASVCLEQARCRAIQMWGFTDQYSFRSIFNPLPFDRAYQPKPAYEALRTIFATQQP